MLGLGIGLGVRVIVRDRFRDGVRDRMLGFGELGRNPLQPVAFPDLCRVGLHGSECVSSFLVAHHVARFLLHSRNRLEHIACPCPVIIIYLNRSPSAKDILVPTGISRHHYLIY